MASLRTILLVFSIISGSANGSLKPFHSLAEVSAFVNVDRVGATLLFSSCFPTFEITFERLMASAAGAFQFCHEKLSHSGTLSTSFVEGTFSALIGLNDEIPSAGFALCVLQAERLLGADRQPRTSAWVTLLSSLGAPRAQSAVRRCATFAAGASDWPATEAPWLQFLACVKSELVRQCLQLRDGAPEAELAAAAAAAVRAELRQLHELHGEGDRRSVARLPSFVRLVTLRAPAELHIAV